MLLICLLALDRAKLFKFDRDLMKSLAGLLAVFVAVDAFFIACECLTMGYPGAGEAEALAIMATGKTAPFFWFEIIGGLAVPFLVLVFARNREKPACVVLTSALIVLGVFCKRAWLLLTSFTVPERLWRQRHYVGYGCRSGRRCRRRVDYAGRVCAYAAGGRRVCGRGVRGCAGVHDPIEVRAAKMRW